MTAFRSRKRSKSAGQDFLVSSQPIRSSRFFIWQPHCNISRIDQGFPPMNRPQSNCDDLGRVVNRAFDFVHFQGPFFPAISLTVTGLSACAAAACDEIDHLLSPRGLVTRVEGYFRGSFHESAGAARHTTTRVGNHERSHAKDQWERALRPHLPARARGGGLPAVGPRRAAYVVLQFPAGRGALPGRGDGSGSRTGGIIRTTRPRACARPDRAQAASSPTTTKGRGGDVRGTRQAR